MNGTTGHGQASTVFRILKINKYRGSEAGSGQPGSRSMQQHKKSNNKINYHKNSKNVGKHLSLIKALEKSNSRYVVFLDSMDFLIPNAIDKLFDYTLTNNVDLAYGKIAKKINKK